MKSMYCLGVAGRPAIEIPQEELSYLLAQIEAELHRSKAYRSAVKNLQTMLGESATAAKMLVKAVGREAIRLVFQQLAQHYKDAPTVTLETNVVGPQPDTSSPGESSLQSEDVIEVGTEVEFTNLEPDLDTVTTSPAVNTNPAQPNLTPSPILGVTKPTKTLSKTELATQAATQAWEDHLRCLGQELQQARKEQNLSLRQIHEQTLVPLHHIEALENGRVDLLPEDVYIRGFIRHIGDALGLDGMAMATSLPSLDIVKTVVPSWYRPGVASAFHLSHAHLYLGYTALVAGAVGGLTLLSQQSTSGSMNHQDSVQPSSPSVSPSFQKTAPTALGLKSHKAGIAIGTDIAPPEAMGPRTND
jgi:hypothetical protein